MLYNLVYKSRAIRNFDRYDLNNILDVSRRNNLQLEITGMLLYANCQFLQVLEGEMEIVLSLFKTIQNDDRHFDTTVIMGGEIDKRMFPDWSMGYKYILKEEYKNIPGLTLFLDDDKVAKPYELLLQFKNDSKCFKDNINTHH